MIVSMKAPTKVYHMSGCKYAKRIKQENSAGLKKAWAEAEGYRPCRWCCTSMDGRYSTERKKAEKLLEENGLVIDKLSGMLYIRSDIGCWKLVYSRGNDEFLLFHRNRADGITPIENVEDVPYHRQMDSFKHHSILAACQYIIKHDAAKKIIAMDYRKLPQRTRKEKKYYKKAERKERRKNILRIDDLFRQIESESGMKKYSIC
ncbi:MAG: hypothetical protein Q4E57_06525 [Eubacteriales bacterium]|nr:hypothetical protein [Eubacteriales bacterium]